MKYFGNKRAINCPTTNDQVRSSAIHRTFQHYRIKKLIFIQIVLYSGNLGYNGTLRGVDISNETIFAVQHRHRVPFSLYSDIGCCRLFVQ